MRKIWLLIFSLCSSLCCFAQGCDLPISIAFSQESEMMPAAAQNLLTEKLRQILSSNGVSGDMDFNQFALVPRYSVIGKHILAGPPTKVIYNLNITLNVTDTQESTTFSSYSTDIDAIGENETKAFMSGIHGIGNSSQKMQTFIEQARAKILLYYNNNYVRIIQKAKVLAGMNKYDEALFHIMSIPECCQGYSMAMEIALPIYQNYIDREGQKLLMQARATWAAGNNDRSAAIAAGYLVQIDPNAKCYGAANELLNEIKAKASANEPWNFEMKKYNDLFSLESQRIAAARAIGVEYGKGQKSQTTNLMFVK